MLNCFLHHMLIIAMDTFEKVKKFETFRERERERERERKGRGQIVTRGASNLHK